MTNVPLWWGMLIMRKSGGTWEISVPSSQYCYGPKTALIIIIIKVKSVSLGMQGFRNVFVFGSSGSLLLPGLFFRCD